MKRGHLPLARRLKPTRLPRQRRLSPPRFRAASALQSLVTSPPKSQFCTEKRGANFFDLGNFLASTGFWGPPLPRDLTHVNLEMVLQCGFPSIWVIWIGEKRGPVRSRELLEMCRPGSVKNRVLSGGTPLFWPLFDHLGHFGRNRGTLLVVYEVQACNKTTHPQG